MMVNIGTKKAPVNIAFSNSRTHNIIYKTPSLYIERNKNPTFYIVRRSCLCLNTLRGSETTLNPRFLLKSIDNTLQTCVGIANEYLQAYNLGGSVKNHLF